MKRKTDRTSTNSTRPKGAPIPCLKRGRGAQSVLRTAFVTTLLLLPGTTTFAVDYTVAPGDAGADFATIQAAAEAVRPGDRVIVGAGVYREQVRIAASGTRAAPIVFEAAAGEEVIIDGTEWYGQWQSDGAGVFRAPAANITKVIVDGEALVPAADRASMTAGTFVADGSTCRVWAPDGLTPQGRATGLLRDEWNIAVYITGSHIVFRDIGVRHGSANGLRADGDSVRIEGCSVAFARAHGLTLHNSWGSEVIDCDVHDNVLENWPRGWFYSNGGWGMGLSYYSGGNGRIENCRVYRNHGEGIGTFGGATTGGTQGLIIRGNVSYDNWSVNIWNDHGSNVTVDGNLVYVSGDQPYPDERRSTPTGLLCAEEASFGTPGDLRGGVYTNNVVVGCGQGFSFWHDGGGLVDFLVANNTFVNNDRGAIGVDSGGHSGNVFRNNIIVQRVNFMMRFGAPGNTVFDHNCWYSTEGNGWFEWGDSGVGGIDAYRSVSGQGAGSPWREPLFAVGSGFAAENYTLSTGSPCLDSGVSIDRVTTDYAGNARPSSGSCTIGAFEGPLAVLTQRAPGLPLPRSGALGYVDLRGRRLRAMPHVVVPAIRRGEVTIFFDQRWRPAGMGR